MSRSPPVPGHRMADRHQVRRIWWVRPVSSRTRRSVAAGSASSSAKCVTAARGWWAAVGAHARAVAARCGPAGHNSPRARGGPPLDEGQVLADELAPGQRLAQRPVRRLVRGRRRAAPTCPGRGGAAIPARPLLPAPGAPGQHLAERPLAVPGGRVDDEPQRRACRPRAGARPRRGWRRGSAGAVGAASASPVRRRPRRPRAPPAARRWRLGTGAPSTVTRPSSIRRCAPGAASPAARPGRRRGARPRRQAPRGGVHRRAPGRRGAAARRA